MKKDYKPMTILRMSMLQIQQGIVVAKQHSEDHFDTNHFVDPMSFTLRELVDYLVEAGYVLDRMAIDGVCWKKEEDL